MIFKVDMMVLENNKENEHGEQGHTDHLYYNREFKEQESTTTSAGTSGPQKKKSNKITKSARLQESLKTNNRFIEINSEKFHNDKLYQERKIQILESESIHRKSYMDQKLLLWQSIADSFSQISNDIREIKNKILETGYII